MIDRIVVLAVLLAAGACGAKDDDAAGDDFVDPYMDQPLPPSCRDTSSGPCEDSTGDPPECTASVECPDEQVCAASFDGDIGTFRCEASCIATDDEARWCFDDAACCDASARCIRGLCGKP